MGSTASDGTGSSGPAGIATSDPRPQVRPFFEMVAAARPLASSVPSTCRLASSGVTNPIGPSDGAHRPAHRVNGTPGPDILGAAPVEGRHDVTRARRLGSVRDHPGAAPSRAGLARRHPKQRQC
jgi:hypothetical protein